MKSYIIVIVAERCDMNIGISPSGKALDSDSSIRGFKSLYPSYLPHTVVCVRLFFIL